MIFADGGYAGKLEAFVQNMGRLFGHAASFAFGIVKKLEDQKGFVVLPCRWVIERSFGWLVQQRRLTRDHEKNPRHHEAFVYLAFIGIMTQRLTASQLLQPFAG
ncbi:MAG: transposase [Verrucomicrobiaceae bacterium]|nr:transposase [Verrucomicrobiaceae bacterium]